MEGFLVTGKPANWHGVRPARKDGVARAASGPGEGWWPMRFRGTESWCFESKDSERLDIALFVRDAVRLDVPESPRVPPRLGSTVPDRTSLLTPNLRARAAEAWAAWWDVLVADESWPYGSESTPILAEWEPSQESVLRRPFVQLNGEAAEWRATRPDVGWESGIPWDITASIAADVAFDRDRPIGEVRGVAIVVSAPGPWWFRPAPGVVLCTRDATRDPALAPIIVRAAFDPEMAV